MTAISVPDSAPPSVSVGHPGVTQARVVRSEWIKLKSLRSTWFSFGAAMLATIGLGILFSAVRGHDAHVHQLPDLDGIQVTLRGIYLAQLAVGVLGVLLISGEYATGMIRASLSAVPRRVPVLAAKALVFGAVTFVLCLVMALIAFLAGQSVLGGYGYGSSLADSGSLRAVFGTALYLTLIGLLALGLGFAIRSTGGAVATLFGVVLVLPALSQALPTSWQEHINKYLPLNIGNELISRHPDRVSLSTGAGIAVLIIWTAVAITAGLLVLRRRDA
jgi:ABC-2 type transport system permease protein